MKGAGDHLAAIRRKRLLLLALVLIMAGAALFAAANGSAGLSVPEIFQALTGSGEKRVSTILFNVRLPRIAAAVVSGAGLAAAGCVMQTLLDNPLAGASTLGISQGAAFGAAFAIIVLGAGSAGSSSADGMTFSDPAGISMCAFVGSMLSTGVILGLSRFRKISPQVMVLTGVALSSLFQGAASLMQYFADEVKVSAVVFWSYGSLGSVTWREIGIMALAVAAAMVYFFLCRKGLNALLLGSRTAQSLGTDTDRLLLVGMTVCSALTSVIVSYVGIINFIGLIAPHMMRRFFGNDHRFLLPASALAGSCLMLVSDTAARLIVKPTILPIGAITSFLGAPLFLWLIFRTKTNKE